MPRRFFAPLLALAFLLAGCSPGLARYSTGFYDTFDTYVEITAYARDAASFERFADDLHGRLLTYHALFDIYNDYEGLNNIKTVNDAAGQAPVAADAALIGLVSRSKEMYELTEGAVNAALGPVLNIWHDYRAAGLALPPEELLRGAAELCDMDDVRIDREAGTVFLAKAGMRLDLGASAKGYAVERAVREADTSLVADFLISAGGNVLARTSPGGGAEDAWRVGLLDPDGGFLGVLPMAGGSAVTSGDYQRYYTVDGVRYGHIIDPATLYPARSFRQVTVTGPDSGEADFLSTALFILPYEKGRALAESLGYDALWVFADGSTAATEGAETFISPRR